MTRIPTSALVAALATALAAGCTQGTGTTKMARGRSGTTVKAPAAPTPPAGEAPLPAPPAGDVRVGQLAPDFEVTTTDGKMFKLSEQRGKVVLVNFFATWCPPCKTEMPHLQQDVFEKIKSDRFVMIALGREHDNATVARYKAERRLGFPMAGDPGRAVFSLYAEKGIPRTLLIDRDGRVIFETAGYSDSEFKEMLALIRARLAGAGGSGLLRMGESVILIAACGFAWPCEAASGWRSSVVSQPLVIEYHLVWTAYGWWLPNDPRGSGSKTIQSHVIAQLGELHFGRKRLQPVGREIRRFYEQAAEILKYPLATFDAASRQEIASSFGRVIDRERLTCYACAIMPDHVHMLIRKHKHQAEDMIELLRSSSKDAVRRAFPSFTGHPVWNSGSGWKVFLDHPEEIRRTIAYIEKNPNPLGLPRQYWPFVVPYDGWPLHPGHSPNSPYARRLRELGRYP